MHIVGMHAVSSHILDLYMIIIEVLDHSDVLRLLIVLQSCLVSGRNL